MSRGMSRRAFFRCFRDDLIDQIDTDRVKGLVGKVRLVAKSDSAQWIEIGPLTMFPPGSTRQLELPSKFGLIRLISRAEGLTAISATGATLALACINGRVRVNPGTVWRPNEGISIMTGEKVTFDDTQEMEG